MDTPRTDAAWNGAEAQDCEPSSFVVPLEFARGLEEENIRLREALYKIEHSNGFHKGLNPWEICRMISHDALRTKPIKLSRQSSDA